MTNEEQHELECFVHAQRAQRGLLNATDAARVAGISRQAMEQLHQKEDGPFSPLRFFGNRYFSFREVLEFAEKRHGLRFSGAFALELIRRQEHHTRRRAGTALNVALRQVAAGGRQ